MTITEFFAGNGCILSRSSAMNPWNSGFVNDPSTIFAQIIPSVDRAGSNEYLRRTLRQYFSRW